MKIRIPSPAQQKQLMDDHLASVEFRDPPVQLATIVQWADRATRPTPETPPVDVRRESR